MNTFEYLSNTQLIKAINTVKNYIKIDTDSSKVTFTNNYDCPNDETTIYVDLCDQSGLHYHCQNLLDSIIKQWGFHCYHYENFTSFLRQVYSISEWQYQQLKSFVED